MPWETNYEHIDLRKLFDKYVYIYIRRFVYALCLPVSDSSLLCWISDGHRKMDNTGKRLLPKHQEIYISTNSVSS